MGKPNFEDYIKAINNIFQKELDIKKIEVLKDLYENWEKIERQADERILTIYMETFIIKTFFKHNFQYHFWLGLRIVFFILGLITFIVSWSIALSLIIISVFLHFFSSYIKLKEVKKMEKNQINFIINRDYNKGLVGFSVYYLVGAYQIVTKFGKATFPQKVSSLFNEIN